MVRRLSMLLLAPLGALLLVGLLLQVLTPVSAAGGDTYCVVPLGAPAGPFAACAAVFDDPQVAADAAPAGAQLRVAAGTFTQVHDLDGLRQVLLLERDVELSGGWLPPFDALPDPAAHPTVLDAGYGGRVVYISGSVSVSITGVSLQRGDATGLGGFGDPARAAAGGGLYANGATLLLSRTVISGNRAMGNSASEWSRASGGGVALIDSTAILSGNHFAENVGLPQPGNGSRVEGGALYAEASELHVVSNTFRHNRSNHLAPGSGRFSGSVRGSVCIQEFDRLLFI